MQSFLFQIVISFVSAYSCVRVPVRVCVSVCVCVCVYVRARALVSASGSLCFETRRIAYTSVTDCHSNPHLHVPEAEEGQNGSGTIIRQALDELSTLSTQSGFHKDRRLSITAVHAARHLPASTP